MMRRGQHFFLLLTVCAAVLVLAVFGTQTDDEPDYTVFSAGRQGVSLLYDTLQRMGYPVAVAYTPVPDAASIRDVQIIIRPDNPLPNAEMIREMLEWVSRGGRLIFLDDYYPTAMDIALTGLASTELGNLTHYYVGKGEVVTGFAEDITNANLLHDNRYGMLMHYTLAAWNPAQVFFNEYYHGYQKNDNLFARLPTVIKLVVYQLILLAAVYAWHKGKRLGKPIPYYAETEREENEQVKATARLYAKYYVTPMTEDNP